MAKSKTLQARLSRLRREAKRQVYDASYPAILFKIEKLEAEKQLLDTAHAAGKGGE